MSNRYVALLRGINVGGKNILPMKSLEEMFTSVGCSCVRTYIQSGNVIFSTTPNVVEDLCEQITTKIFDTFGHQVPVMLRSEEQFTSIIRNNPYLELGASAQCLHVLFLSEVPLPSCVETLDPDRSLPDTFAARGQEVYLHLQDGVAGTKLTTAYFDTRLKTISTGRNWQTVTRIAELLRG